MKKTDSWYLSLMHKLNGERNQIGFYSKIVQRRWIASICRILEGIPHNSKILKTDAWNEAAGKSLLEDFKYKYNIHICDISAAIIKLVSTDFPNSYNMDIRNLNFPEQYFDVVLDISTSDHCKESEFKSIVDGYSRILRQNGRLLLIHNSNKSVIWKLLRKIGYYSPAYSGFPPVYYFSPEFVKSILQSNFKVIDIRCTNAFSWAKPLLNKIPISNEKLIDNLSKLELNINHNLLSVVGRQYLFFCERK